MDNRARSLVVLYAANEVEFFRTFAEATEKVRNYNIKTGRVHGEGVDAMSSLGCHMF